MKRHFVNDNYFTVIDSEEKAYLLGFFIADGTIGINSGCKNSYFMQINISYDDCEILELYQNQICPENKISITNYQGGSVCHRKPVGKIKWTSNNMKNDLYRYNIHMRKTYEEDFVFPFEVIPKDFVWDFIRGYFDGDGQISYNTETHISTFAIYGTSKKFLYQIGKIFESEFNVEMRLEDTTKQNITLWCLRFFANYKKKEFFKKLYEKFYLNKKCFLNRKKNKFQQYLMFQYRANQEDCERLLDSVEHS